MRIASLVPIAVGVLVVVVLAGCAGIPGPTPSVRSVEPRVERVDPDGVDMAFDVKVGNPLLNALHSPRYRYSIDVDGRTLASGRSAAGTEFPAAGVGTVSIPVRVAYVDLQAAYGDLAGRGDVPFVLRGAFAVPLFGSRVDLPFEHTGALPVVRAPTLRIVGFDDSHPQDSDDRVYVEVALRNPNAFAISLDQTGYRFSVDGDPYAALGKTDAGIVGARTEMRLRVPCPRALAATVRTLASARGWDHVAVEATGAIGTLHGRLRLAD